MQIKGNNPKWPAVWWLCYLYGRKWAWVARRVFLWAVAKVCTGRLTFEGIGVRGTCHEH